MRAPTKWPTKAKRIGTANRNLENALACFLEFFEAVTLQYIWGVESKQVADIATADLRYITKELVLCCSSGEAGFEDAWQVGIHEPIVGSIRRLIDLGYLRVREGGDALHVHFLGVGHIWASLLSGRCEIPNLHCCRGTEICPLMI